ncbi:MAG TPA: PQQ-binding-like beta-propeller repeat protein [Streptosporangiaceae bacterium]
MLGSRQRLVIGAAATLAAIVAGAVLVDRFMLQAEWWQVDRTETIAAEPPLAPLGPPPGPVATTWQLTTPVHHSGLPPYDQVAHAVVAGELIVVSGRGLSVRDARTGGERWHYYRTGWSLLGWAQTVDRIVVYQERDGNRGDRLLLGLDVVSGRELWRQSGAAPAATDRTTLRWPAASGMILTTDGDRTTLHGRSAETGRRLWTRELPAGCVLPEAAPYASDATDAAAGSAAGTAAVALDCTDHSRVLAVDPATGHVRLDAPFGAADPPELAVRGGTVAVFDGTALRVYADGKELLSRGGDDACATMCPVDSDGRRLVMVYRTGTGRSKGKKAEPAPGTSVQGRMEAVDLGSGRSLWRRDVPDYAAMTVRAGRLYALRPSLAPNLLPAGIDIVDLTSGDVTTVPAPVVLGSRRDVARPWLGAGGGLLYVAVPEAAPRPFGAARLAALRGAGAGPGPAELDGVRAAEWPDACGLLRKRDLADSGHGMLGYEAHREYARVGAVRLPHAVSCTYEPPGEGQQSAAAPRVTVEWVAGTPAAASGLLAALRATQGRARDIPGIGDEAYELGLPSGTIVVRVGRYVLAVDAFQAPGMATRLARSAAAHLRAQ